MKETSIVSLFIKNTQMYTRASNTISFLNRDFVGIACSSSLASCFQPYFGLFCLQMFPGTEGWPFLRYHGSCGRMMVWAGSKPLRSLFSSPLERRADIAYQLLHITQSLSSNSLQFSLFFTSLSEDMFGTLDDNRVFIVDASTIGIIDLQEGQFWLSPICSNL